MIFFENSYSLRYPHSGLRTGFIVAGKRVGENVLYIDLSGSELDKRARGPRAAEEKRIFTEAVFSRN